MKKLNKPSVMIALIANNQVTKMQVKMQAKMKVKVFLKAKKWNKNTVRYKVISPPHMKKLVILHKIVKRKVKAIPNKKKKK